ncbi:MAG: YlbF family regulator [Coprobacillus sp.]
MKKLNKDIAKKADNLNQWILEQEVVQEFQRYETLIRNNQELMELEDELKLMQKEIVNQKHQGLDCSLLIQTYEDKKKNFDENPIVYNYLVLKEEVNALIYQIQNDLNKQLNKKVD